MVYGGWVYGGWITTVVIIRPSQPSLAGVGAGAELGNIYQGCTPVHSKQMWI